MKTDKQLLEQALEALKGFVAITSDSQGVKGYHLNGDIAEWDEFDEVDKAREAIIAIKQALAAPVQEPDHGDELTIAYMSGLQRGKDLAARHDRVRELECVIADLTAECKELRAAQPAPQDAREEAGGGASC